MQLVERWTGQSKAGVSAALVVIVALAFVPGLMGAGWGERMTALFIWLILAAMWNALAIVGWCRLGSNCSLALGPMPPFASPSPG